MPEGDRDWAGFRLEIDGKWAAAEMAMVLSDLSVLYEIRRALEDFDPSAPPEEVAWWLRRGRYARWPRRRRALWEGPWSWRLGEDELALRRIEYGSPGFVDLAGIGKVVEQLRLFIEKLIDLPDERRRRKREDQDMAVDIEAKKIANAKAFLELVEHSRRLGIPDDDLRSLLFEVDEVQERLLRQVEDGKIRGVKLIEPGGEEPEEG